MIGASRRPGTIGHQIVHNLLSYGYTGAVYPVNPNASSICSVHCHARITDIPEPIDVAVIAVPRERVLEVAESCSDAKVKALIVISAGFREMGREGAAREQALVAIVRASGMRMVGPNCLGIVNADPAVSMNATFATAMPPFGGMAFVSQSGALGLSVLDSAREYGIGMSQFVSVGNKPDVSGNDLLLAWEHDPLVTCILMYVENFGNPARFLDIAGRITRVKPIIVVKSGRSRAGARAASSHTGALAANDSAVTAMLAQAGVLRASSIEEMFEMAMAFEVRALPRSRRTAVLTNAGGPGILAADAMDACGLELAELSAETVERLRPLFPAEASIRNPLDMIASATPAGYSKALTALLADPGIDAVVPIFVPPFGIRQEDVADAIVGAAATNAEKPVLAVLMGREGLPYGRAELHGAGIPAFVFPESAARALSALNRQVEWIAQPLDVHTLPSGIDQDRARATIDGAEGERREHLTPQEALDVLAAYGIPVAVLRLATSVDAAVEIAAAITYPVVIKIASPDVIHKTDIGGVRVGIASESELRRVHEDMLRRVRAAAPTARVSGVLVQQMVIQTGCETIVGMTRDPSFGPLVMFGLGGIFVESLGDVVFRMVPIGEADAVRMTTEIRAARVLDGVRGAPPADRAALAQIIRRIAQLSVDFPAIVELDVNPLLASDTGVLALDARIRIAPASQAS